MKSNLTITAERAQTCKSYNELNKIFSHSAHIITKRKYHEYPLISLKIHVSTMSFWEYKFYQKFLNWTKIKPYFDFQSKNDYNIFIMYFLITTGTKVLGYFIIKNILFDHQKLGIKFFFFFFFLNWSNLDVNFVLRKTQECNFNEK